MLSVIIPTEGVEQSAVATLAALVPGAAAGVIKEVLLVDRAGTGVIERVGSCVHDLQPGQQVFYTAGGFGNRGLAPGCPGYLG